MTDMRQTPLPSMADPDTAGFFEAANRGQLVVKCCNACGHLIHLPRALCDQCRSLDTGWKVVEPRGRIYTFSVVQRQVHPAFPAPCTLIVVELDDAPGVRLMGNLPGEPDVEVGAAVEGVFEQVEDSALLRWRLIGD
jgi:uncharacterized protein